MSLFKRDRCYNGGKCHNFKSVYEEIESKKADTEYRWAISGDEYRKMFYDKIYVHDICRWCGDKVKRDE